MRLARLLLVCAASRAVQGFSILQAFQQHLFPTAELGERNAASRRDGYWPYVSRKEEPPVALTYGEFPLELFSEVIDRSCELASITDRSRATFADLGSGAGRLVLWAAANDEWRSVHGLEVLPGLHSEAIKKLSHARYLVGLELRTPTVEFVEGSWDDPAALPWGAIDVAFACARRRGGPRAASAPRAPSRSHLASSRLLSPRLDRTRAASPARADTTAFPHDGDGVLVDLTRALARRLSKGCVVCTTDYQLGEGFEVLESLEGANEGVGGTSTCYIHRKVCDGESVAVGLTERVAELEEALEERDARIGELSEALAAKEELIAELQTIVDELQQEMDEVEDSMLGSMKRWAEESGYFAEGGKTDDRPAVRDDAKEDEPRVRTEIRWLDEGQSEAAPQEEAQEEEDEEED
jgi:uncharacterized coiled-coil protein SlyX